MPAQPQDHKQKQTDFTFTVDGKKYKLPPITEDTAQKIPGGLSYDAIMNPDDNTAQMRLAFATLEAAGPSKASFDALKSLPFARMLEVVGEWMGESSGSSD